MAVRISHGFEKASRMLRGLPTIVTALAVLLASTSLPYPARADEKETRTPLQQSVVDQVAALVDAEDAPEIIDGEGVQRLFDQAVVADGNTVPLLDWLTEERGSASGERAQRLLELDARISSKRGDLKRASERIDELLKSEEVNDSRLDLRLWQARLYDALGKVEEATATYKALTELDLPEADQQMVRLRLALMGLIGKDSRGSGGDAKPLIKLAGDSEDVQFRNRAAIVLAVQNQFAEAIKLFTVQGKGTIRFRNASRIAEWAIRANDRSKAIEHSWDAVKSAQIKRDRRYALALLVEAHRLKDEKKGLIALVDEFGSLEANSDPVVTPELRSVWIELLRELERHDDAIALFKASAGDSGGFTIEMRRELLEMEGAAGKTDQLIQSYRDLIASEPRQLVWRSGLTRVLLEEGRDKDARALWTAFIADQVSGTVLLQSAQALGDLGLDDLAADAVNRAVSQNNEYGQALLYLAELHQIRGRMDEAEGTLNRLNELSGAGDAVRFELAAAFERIGRQDKAVEVMEGIRDSREEVAADLEMRLAWLYSEIGVEDKALEQWFELWRKTRSVARRRYVEDRLMTVASRLGTLGDLAVDLEVKLMDGEADDREAGLLVRIYSRVNDSVAASEVLEEYMKQTGRDQVERLQEKGRIYQICADYWNYEKVIEELIEIDPEGRTEYLRQLALSMLERGKAKDARDVLLQLRDADDGKDDSGGEFEAGVLSLVGLNKEASDAYRRGIATHPDRIESYLLLAELLKDMGEKERAVGMFQYLAETADKDDLFTIAIDGLLNMEADARIMQWARRITLERLAGRDDKNYLYQLLSDLSAEVNDKPGQIRALENSLAVSGTRRLSVLRECMDLSSRIRGGVFYSRTTSGPTNAGNKPFFAFGRRLIGLGELMPPQVFLDLGQAFLADGDIVSAERTFSMARNLADERSYQRDVAAIFEKASKRAEALVRYDRLLRTSPSDVALIARVAKLNEQEGDDAAAARFYQRGYDLLLAQTPLTTDEDVSRNQSAAWSWGGNRDAYQTYFDRLLRGVAVTLSREASAEFLKLQRAKLAEDIQSLNDSETRSAALLSESPRIERRTEALRRLYLAFDSISQLEDMDQTLIKQFSEDTELPTTFAQARLTYGRGDSARRMLAEGGLTDEQKEEIAKLLGNPQTGNSSTRTLQPNEMWKELLPVMMAGDRDSSLKLLRRLDRTKISGSIPGQNTQYVYVNGRGIRTTVWASDVYSLINLALELGDEGLALQFARTRLQGQVASVYSATPDINLMKSLQKALPRESFLALARYAANAFKDDDKKTLSYLWLMNQMGEELGEELPEQEELLEKIDSLSLRLNYYNFSFEEAAEIFPESILADALAKIVENTDPKMLPGPLMLIAFQHPEPLSEEVREVIRNGIAKGVGAAQKENMLRYSMSYFPRAGKLIRNLENGDLAIECLDLIIEGAKGNRTENVAHWGEANKVIALSQIGREEEATEIAMRIFLSTRPTTDYYERMARTRVEAEFVAKNPEPFLAAMKKKQEGEKPTVAETSKVLAFLLKTNDETRIRDAYEEAWKVHPDQTSFVDQYERWEQRAGRISNAIKINERRIELLTAADAEKNSSQISSIRRRLSQLWQSLDQPVKALELWKPFDDQDIAAFESLKKQRQKDGKAVEPPEEASKTSATSSAPAARRAVMTPTGVVYVTTSSSIPRSSNAGRKSIKDVKTSLDDGKPAEAAKALRWLWRGYPPVVESPYGSRFASGNVNSLYWPTATAAKPEKEQTEEPDQDEQEAEKRRQEAARKARQRERGGLATLDPEPTKPRDAVQRQTVWKALASEPFAMDEMNRILRSRTADELKMVDSVIVGMLQAEVAAEGEEAVFERLVERMKQGRLGHVEMVQLFTLVDEKPERLAAQSELLDELLKRVDMDQLARLAQLARYYGDAGRLKEAKALYRHCALRAAMGDSPTTGSLSLNTLFKQAREVVGEEEILPLAEQMFAVCPIKDDRTVGLILDLRDEKLDAAEAARRSRSLFSSLSDDPDGVRIAQAVRGARTFAKAGDIPRAVACLRSALLRNELPTPVRNVTGRNEAKLTRTSFLMLFPKETDSFGENLQPWLRGAANEIVKLESAGTIKDKVAQELKLIVAHRMATSGTVSDAAVVLRGIGGSEALSDIKLSELAIDVLREAGLWEEALKLEQKKYRTGGLKPVRYADLLLDTARVAGDAEAQTLAAELLELSLDEELVGAARDIAAGAPKFSEEITQLASAATAAREEYSKRQSEAARRGKIRAAWTRMDREADKKKEMETDQTKSATKTRAIPAAPLRPAIIRKP